MEKLTLPLPKHVELQGWRQSSWCHMLTPFIVLLNAGLCQQLCFICWQQSASTHSTLLDEGIGATLFNPSTLATVALQASTARLGDPLSTLQPLQPFNSSNPSTLGMLALHAGSPRLGDSLSTLELFQPFSTLQPF